MTSTTITNSEALPLFDFFVRGKYNIPWHQRRYDWKKEHVAKLLEDILDAKKRNQSCYFLGSLFLINEHNKQQLINDGQQRVITYSLICACFLRLFHTSGDKDLESKAARVLFDISESETFDFVNIHTYSARLTPSKSDEKTFNLIIHGENIGKRGKLTVAWSEIDVFVSGLKLPDARSYFKFFLDKIEISCLTIPSNINPNMIYETLNFRGKSLDDFDLIRNHVYSFFNEKNESTRRNTIKAGLDGDLHDQLENSNKVTEYARCYLQSIYGFLPKTRFYSYTRQKINEEAQKYNGSETDYIFKMANNLATEKNIELFKVIRNIGIGNPFINDFNRHAKLTKKTRNLHVLLDESRRYTVTQPLVFALLNSWGEINSQHANSKKEVTRIIFQAINNINSFVMRTALVTGKFESSRFEETLSGLACRVMKANTIDDLVKIDILDTLSKNLDNDVIMSDKKFRNYVSELEIRDSAKAKRFLFAINAYIQSDWEVLLLHKLTLEHVLPTSDVHWAGWKGFDANHHDYAHRIGNLTLLDSADNKPSAKYNSGGITSKTEIFATSALTINKELATHNTWTPELITKRQSEMADIATKVWRFSSEKISQ